MKMIISKRTSSKKNLPVALSNRQGFSLIEVLFSMSMFTLGILGVVSLINQSMAASMNRRNETIAGQLAQEGIELVRNIRDNNWLSGTAAFEGIQSGRIDYDSVNSVESSGAYDLRLNSDGLYEHGSEEFFKRRIIVVGDTTNKTIQSVVTWGGDTPTDSPSESNCNPSTRCFFVEVTLSGTWGEIN